MSKTTTVQIPVELWNLLWDYHIRGNETPETAENIKIGLRKKGAAMRRRALYALASQGNEDARQDYLDEVGINKDFRW